MHRSHNHNLAIEVVEKLGLPVFPVREKSFTYTVKGSGKSRTLKAKSPYTRNGFKSATKDLQKVEELWAKNPNAAVGVPMGLDSSLVAIDIDNGPEKTGEASWLLYNFDLPPTVQTRTISGGRHIFFKLPMEIPIKNSASTFFGKDVDVRGIGGYVVWAGSKMADGDYSYIDGCTPSDVSFAVMPEQILDIFKKGPIKARDKEPKAGPVKEGSRNDTLFRKSVSQVHAGLSDAAVMQNARETNDNFKPPLDGDEVERTVGSAQGYRKNHILAFTDLGNAERLRRDHYESILFVKEEKRWRIYDGSRWVVDSGAVERRAHETIRRIISEAGNDPEELQRAVKWQKTSESSARIKALLEVASSLEGLTVSKQELDKDLNLINFVNGTLDLKSGNFREHQPSNYLTRMAGCLYDPNAISERWLRFIDEIMDGSEEDSVYLQKLGGYFLWGKRPEQIIQFFKGDGGDGKSVFVETIRKLLGDYQITLPALSLSSKNPSSIPNDIARISGARLVAVSELPKAMHLNTQLVKGISGGDTMTARFLHQEFFDFEPEAVLLVVTNFYPFGNIEDEAYFRRLRILRFPRNFSDGAPDLHLRERLATELPGILNWAIQGYNLYRSEGLSPTTSMCNELQQYQRFTDPLDGFFETSIEVTNVTANFIPTDELLDAAQKFGRQEDRDSIHKTDLVRYMRSRGFNRVQRRDGRARVRGYSGIKVVEYKEDNLPF